MWGCFRKSLPQVRRPERSCPPLPIDMGFPNSIDRCRHDRWLCRLPGERRLRTGRRRHLARHHADLKLLSDHPVFAPQYGIYSHRIGDQWLAGGASNCGGRRLRSHFSREDIARLRRSSIPMSRPDSTIIRCHRPGERFPINDPALNPRFTPRPDDEPPVLPGPARRHRWRRSTGLSPPRRTWRHAAQDASAGRRWCRQRALDQDPRRLRAFRKRLLPRACGDGHGATGLARHRAMRH